ncbi:uncharacterized protein LOC134658734 [Cydia amplana]|uniref:uncharacterized protein LOC134658734 n=1 Tax=Cydia amplana TaxID=1869771 RepID=UPI002FE6081F
MNSKDWKKFKRSGGYRRKVKKVYENMVLSITPTTSTSVMLRNEQSDTKLSASGSVEEIFMEHEESSVDDYICSGSDSDTDISLNEELKKIDIRSDIRDWAVKYNISHIALNNLLNIMHNVMPHKMPLDARTLLKTNKVEICITEIGTGHYWHNGLLTQLQKTLQNHEVPNKITLNLNIDGLPIYKSSNHQLWPILCNITEIKYISPIVVGIYEGKSKPSDLNLYLKPFVNEMKQIENGFTITTLTGELKTIEVSIRAFICDSPARAFIKGVSNFNSKHGCLKCTVVGDYSHLSHTVIFPQIDCPKRNDDDFRNKKYGLHHKVDSPLIELKIDMIENFPVGDSLHLIDLGVMKRLLMGWRDGNFINKRTKWCHRDIEKVNEFLVTIKLPKEIHRSVRTIDVLSHWKGSEYRTFLLYLSLVILKHVLDSDAYKHFICLFCAITICSNENHFKFLRLAQALLNSFVKKFAQFYGKDYITSNVHNLSHLVDEVRKFGTLQSFNAYPFENKLQIIKHMLRQGNKPLTQVARRLHERNEVEMATYTNNELKYPFAKQCNSRNGHILILHFESFILSSQKHDKWFLTTDEKVIEIKAIRFNEDIRLEGYRIDNLIDAFDYPLKSSLINIYKCENYTASTSKNIHVFACADIKCKLVNVEYNSILYFIPLIHTL